MNVKKLVFCFLTLLWGNAVYSQLFDDFSDGNFTANPVWTGMDSNFTVDLQRLRLDDSARIFESYLVTPFQGRDSIEWRFYVKLGFNPSSANQAYVYLMSDTNVLLDTVRGYFVLIGNTADEIALYRQDNTRSSANRVKLIDGVDKTLDTDSVNVSVKVRRDHMGNWELWRDLNGGENFVSEGTAQDSTYKTNAYFGVLCDYTLTRSKDFYFDDIYAGPYIFDTIKPELLSISNIGSDSLLLTFSEDLLFGPATNLSNYSLASGIPLLSARLSGDPSIIEIKTGSPLPNGSTDTLFIANQVDLAGNPAGALQKPFTILINQKASYQDVVINEFMADPSPPVALPDAEFIELYNRSEKFFNLRDWTYSDLGASVSLPDFWLLPNAYVILCREVDSATFAQYGTVLALSSLPALNNGGDLMEIKDSDSDVIDVLQYDITWYKDAQKEAGGFSLEKINPFGACDGKSNWMGSESLDGGTPGQINAVFDTSGAAKNPEIVEVVINDSVLELYFDLSLDTSGVSQAKFTWTNDNGFSDSLRIGSYGLDFIRLLHSHLIDTGSEYAMEAKNLLSCDGSFFDAHIEGFGIGRSPEVLDLIISECYPIPAEANSGRPSAEFIEVYNRSNQLIDLSGLEFHDASSSTQFPNKVLRKGYYLSLCPSGEKQQFSGNVYELSSWPSLNNTGDLLSIKTDKGEIIHELNYSDDWFIESGDDSKKAGGWSLEIIDTENPCGGKENWLPSSDPDGNTHGQINSVKAENPDNIAPIARQCLWLDERRIYLEFNEKIWGSNNYTDDFRVELISGESELRIDSIHPYDESGNTYLIYTAANSSFDKDMYHLKNPSLVDCAGNAFEASVVRGAKFPEKGDLKINEILFNPFYSDGLDYLELYNNSGSNLRLDLLSLGVYDAEKNEFKSYENLSDKPLVMVFKDENEQGMDSENYLLLSEDAEAVYRLYHGLEPNDRIQTEALIYNMKLPSYNNSEGWVYLFNQLGDTIDYFIYNEEMHHPVLEHVDGVSLEKYEETLFSNDPRNWTSATEGPSFGPPINGTPGHENSVKSNAGNTQELFYVEPELFVPNTQGRLNKVYFHFNLPEQAAYAASLTIYRDNGLEVKKMLNNEPISNNSVLAWDGIVEGGSPAKVGVYVVLFEAFEPGGNTLKEKRIFTIAPSN